MCRSEIRSRFDNGDRIKKTLLATGNYTQYTYDHDRPDLIRARRISRFTTSLML